MIALMTRMFALYASEALRLYFLNRDINLQLPLERFHFVLQLTDDLRGFTHVLHHFAFQVMQPVEPDRERW